MEVENIMMHDPEPTPQELPDSDRTLSAYRDLLRREGVPLDYIDRLIATLHSAGERMSGGHRPIVDQPAF